MDPLSVTASIIAVLQATNAVISICYDYSSAIKGSSWELTKVIEEVRSLRDVLETLEQLARKAETTGTRAGMRLPTLKLLCDNVGHGAPLTNCLLELENLRTRLSSPSWSGPDGSKRKAIVQAMTWPLKEGDTRKTLDSIGRFKETLSLALDTDQATMLLAVQDMARTTQDTTSNLEKDFSSMKIDHEREKIHTWLSAPDPSSNHNKACKQRYAMTGNWFLDSKQFADWKVLPNSFIWLHGTPGCGKTILSSTIIHDIKTYCQLNSTRAVAYFYFDFNEPEKQRPENMIRSIITQLSFQYPSMSRALKSLFSSCTNGERQPAAEALIATLHQIIQGFDQTFIILDALDECTDRTELLEYVEIIAGWKLRNLHVIATSRKEKDLEDYLGPLLEEQDKIYIQSGIVDKDILAYINERLQTDRSLSRWRTMPKAQEEIKVALMNKAHGMFRWAVCQLDALKSCFNVAMLRKSLATLPKTLDETYLRILCSIDELYSQHAFTVLEWLVHSARPLRLEELAEVIAIDLDASPSLDVERRFSDPQDVLTICSSLVTTAHEEIESRHDKTTRTIVRLAHFSVQEYLVSERIQSGRATKYSIQKISANRDMAQICLAYLLCFNKSESLREIDKSAIKGNHIDKRIVDKSKSDEFPLALYAAMYWPQHVRVAGENDDAILPLVSELVLINKHTLVNWVRLSDPDHPALEPDMCKESDTIASPLYYAALLGLAEATKLALHSGIDVNIVGGECGTALQAASDRGYVRVVQLLLEHGAAANLNGGEWGTALQLASASGHFEIVQTLLAYEANVNGEDDTYQSGALCAAAEGGYHRIVQLLIEKGAIVNAQGVESGNALQAASSKGHYEICQLLLKERALVNVQGGFYGNALQAASCEGYPEICRLLLREGAYINAPGGQYGSALQAASSHCHYQICGLLLKEGADVNAQGGIYGHALQAASYRGDYRICQLLVKEGANVNAQGGIYGYALQAASVYGHYQTCHLLLKEGANVHAQGGREGTALRAAASKGYSEVVQLLLANGADPNQQGFDTEGREFDSALRAARSRGYAQTVQLLLDNGADASVGEGYSYLGGARRIRIL